MYQKVSDPIHFDSRVMRWITMRRSSRETHGKLDGERGMLHRGLCECLPLADAHRVIISPQGLETVSRPETRCGETRIGEMQSRVRCIPEPDGRCPPMTSCDLADPPAPGTRGARGASEHEQHAAQMHDESQGPEQELRRPKDRMCRQSGFPFRDAPRSTSPLHSQRILNSRL